MPTASELIDALDGTSETARLTRVKPSSVSEWRANGVIPRDKLVLVAVQLEQRTQWRRWHLLPDCWHRIWPELIGTEGAPAVPEVRDAA